MNLNAHQLDRQSILYVSETEFSKKGAKYIPETTYQRLGNIYHPYCVAAAGIQEDEQQNAQPNVCQDQVLWPKVYCLLGSRGLFKHKASTFSDLSKQCF